MILAMTVKGYGTGEAGEANNETHSLKKLDMESLKAFRDRFAIPICDDELEHVPYYRPEPDSPEMRYMQQRREELGGAIPARRRQMELLTRHRCRPSAASSRAAASEQSPPPWPLCVCCPAW